MIKGTTANCKIKSITVTDSTATITCILYSLSPAKQNKAFKFYLRNKDKSLTEISKNIYWIDRLNNYNNDSTNIDVNQYLETIFSIDITNNGTSNLIENKWIRECNLVIRDMSEPITSYAWVSEDLTLVSKEFEIPTIKYVDIYSDENFNLYVDFLYKYKSQADFNYTNSNLKTTLNVVSIYTHNILETLDIDSNNSSKIHATFLNTFKTPIKVQIFLKNKKGDILLSTERLYTPAIRQTTTYIKTHKGIEKVLAYYVKDNTISNNEVVIMQTPQSNVFKRTRETNIIETPRLKVNFNNAYVKLPYIEEPFVSLIGANTLKFVNPNVDTFDNCKLIVYINGILTTETYLKETNYTIENPNINPQSFTILMELQGESKHLNKTKTFYKQFSVTSLCSDRLLCSDNTVCKDS